MKKESRIKNNKGMTLLEIMVVLAILGGLMAVLVTQVMSRLKGAKIKEARIQIAEVGKALDMFYTDCGYYPSTEEGLDALVNQPSNCPSWGPDSYLKKTPKDPWNHAFIYENTGGSYLLVSLGEDGRDGGEGANADISSDDQ